MARTHLISGDGTHFVSETDARRRNKRIIGFISLAIALPFMIAALIGLYLGATGEYSPSLGEGDKITIPTYCWAESTDDAETFVINCD